MNLSTISAAKIITMLCLFSIFILAQEVAVFSSVKGKVSVSGKMGKRKAVSGAKLFNGDRIFTADNSRAQVLYYTGREVKIGPNSNHRIKDKSKAGSLPSNLGKVLRNKLWKKKKGRMVSGTTRQGADGAATATIRPVYPANSKILESRPRFQWLDDNFNDNSRYRLIIESDVSDFRAIFDISGAQTWQYPQEQPALEVDDQYRWYVQSEAGNSSSAYFSRLPEEEMTVLRQELADIESIAVNDSTSSTYRMLSAALYFDWQLIRQAERQMLGFLKAHPEMPQAHLMLASIYQRAGRYREAGQYERQAQSLAGHE